MTELMHFQPGKALYDAYQQGRGNYLAGQAFNSQGDQRQSALGQLAGLNPDKAMALKADFDEQDKADFTEFSNVILNAPEDLKPQIYAKGVQRFGHKIRALGVEPPTDYRQALPLFEQLAKATGGQNTGVQSTFISGGKLNYLTRDGRAVDTGKTVDDTYKEIIDPVTGQVSGYAKRGNYLAPAGTGGATPPPQDAGDPMNPVHERINYTVKAMKDAGVPVEQINAWADNAFAAAQKELSANGVTVQGSAPPPQQARINPKPTAEPAPKTAVAYDKDGNMIIVDASKPGIVPGAVRPGSQMSGAQIAKRQDAARKEKAALDAANQQTDDTVRIIDDLTSSGLEGTVGAFGFLSNIPGTDWADKKAKITTLTARAAFGALQEMRQNSPTGGALGGIAVQELLLLQNAQTQLERAQSPEAFKAALIEFKKALLQTKTRVNRAYAEHYGQDGQGAPQAPQNDDDAMINKYLD